MMSTRGGTRRRQQGMSEALAGMHDEILQGLEESEDSDTASRDATDPEEQEEEEDSSDEEEEHPPLDDEAAARHVFTICKLTEWQKVELLSQGLESMKHISQATMKDIDNMSRDLAAAAKAAPTTTGRSAASHHGRILGLMRVKRLKALIYWCKQQKRRGLPLNPYAFTEEAMDDSMEQLEVDDVEPDSTAVQPTEKFEPKNWISWSKMITAYLLEKNGSNKVPLAYIIRKPRKDGTPFKSDEEARLYETALSGPYFKRDNVQVFNFLTRMLAGSDGYYWLTKYEHSKDGRRAWLALTAFYDGPGENEMRLKHAYNTINNTFYKNEKNFPFSRYISLLQEAFDILEQNRLPKHERDKVEIMVRNIKDPNHKLESLLTFIEAQPKYLYNFHKSAGAVGEMIGKEASRALSWDNSNTGIGKRHISATNGHHEDDRGGGRGGRNRRRGGRGDGRGGRGGRGGSHPSHTAGTNDNTANSPAPQGDQRLNNGVDITDLTRHFPDDEWYALDRATQDKIYQARASNKRQIDAATSDPRFTPPEEISNGVHFGSGAYTNIAAGRGNGPKVARYEA